ncbi:MAG: hypothetical protein EP306_09770 [Burkholderiales bacterium]|nr:MAG: hypothetical protein EP306_09770 [Burkholderiales bacterium]
MNRATFTRRPAALVLGGLLALLSGPGLAEAAFDTNGQGASARLNFVIKIPAVLRIVDNSHPSQLQTDGEGVAVVAQRLELHSNLRQGFCVLLRQPESQALGWSMETVGAASATARPVQGGYHVCFSRPGRHVLNLQHSFTARSVTTPAVLAWPLMTEILAI